MALRACFCDPPWAFSLFSFFADCFFWAKRFAAGGVGGVGASQAALFRRKRCRRSRVSARAHFYWAVPCVWQTWRTLSRTRRR